MQQPTPTVVVLCDMENIHVPKDCELCSMRSRIEAGVRNRFGQNIGPIHISAYAVESNLDDKAIKLLKVAKIPIEYAPKKEKNAADMLIRRKLMEWVSHQREGKHSNLVLLSSDRGYEQVIQMRQEDKRLDDILLVYQSGRIRDEYLTKFKHMIEWADFIGWNVGANQQDQ